MASIKTGTRSFGQEVVTNPAQAPQPTTLKGRFVTLEPLNVDHADGLFKEAGGMDKAALWDYMRVGPFTDYQVFRDQIALWAQSKDSVFFAILDSVTRKVIGHASLICIDTTHRSIEVGNILFTAQLQHTAGATEAMYLMARYIFDDLGYRRYVWECNDLNTPSRRAAQRLGFSFEGVFRQHLILKGHSRDTAWFSMLDSEWSVAKEAFEAWLDPNNFDERGHQRSGLVALRSKLSSA
ncbi:MAG: hypothetical protein M1827_003810 [Pycnora praestabilis]|nr:MAG: hypothetical protein M1827_003810 [Pycnora praestabilis]